MELLQESGTYEVMANTPEDSYRTIEFACRICHGTEYKVKEEASEPLIKRVMAKGHETVLEHRSLLYYMSYQDLSQFLLEYMELKEETQASSFSFVEGKGVIVSMNVHTLRDAARLCDSWLVRQLLWHAKEKYPLLFHDIENLPMMDLQTSVLSMSIYGRVEDLPDWAQPHITPEVHARHSFITVFWEDHSRGCSHELVRHRPYIVFHQRSTRHVKEKNLRFVIPPGKDPKEVLTFYDITTKSYKTCRYEELVENTQNIYAALLAAGWAAQDARQNLPIGVVAPILMTTTHEQLHWMFTLRADTHAHWEIRRTMRRLLAYCIWKWPKTYGDLRHLLEDDGEKHLLELTT